MKVHLTRDECQNLARSNWVSQTADPSEAFILGVLWLWDRLDPDLQKEEDHGS